MSLRDVSVMSDTSSHTDEILNSPIEFRCRQPAAAATGTLSLGLLVHVEPLYM